MEPRDFTPVLALDQLAEGRPRRVEVWDPHAGAQVGVVLVRHHSRLHALGARCSHMGGPLDEGWLLEGGLVCPWHGSRYDLATGEAIDGPSTCPQPRYEVRVCDGVIELRRPPEPGDETILHVPAPQPDPPDPGGKRADEVLFEHHQLLGRLFERVAQSPRHGPERRSLMRLLAHELDMHEQIEDEIFYPAVQPVTEEVPLAHAEHQHLADLLAITLRLDPANPRFEEHLQALRHAVEHHAGAEERTMFPEAQRLGGPRLRRLGRQLEARLAELRDSRLSRARRDLKIRVLEGV
jgi:nitrite reductase/ring-hydroxylating ferredoxin subunit